MPIDHFLNKSIAQLEAMLEQAQDRLLNGAITEVSAAGIRTTRDKGESAEDLIFKIRYSLYLRAAESEDPEAIAKYTNPYASRVTRTRARYL